MAKSAGDKGKAGSAERAVLTSLEGAVGRALEELVRLRARAEAAEARQVEVEELLRKMTIGEASPSEMADRLNELEAENADLRRRVDEGHAGVERLLSQVRFLEDQS